MLDLFFRQNDFLVHNLTALCLSLDDVNAGIELVQVIALHDLTVDVVDFYYSDDFFIFIDLFYISSLTHCAVDADILAVENACVVVSPYIDILSIGEALN